MQIYISQALLLTLHYTCMYKLKTFDKIKH